MKPINAYQTTDGNLFTSEKAATDHQIDLVGVALDTLIPDTGGNITRTDRHKLLMAMIEDDNLAAKVEILQATLTED